MRKGEITRQAILEQALTLASRIGLRSLLGDCEGDVMCTRPPNDPRPLAEAWHRLWFAGIRTAAATAFRGKITLP